MRVLLSDGTGLTARQTATLLSQAGHRVEALSPDPLCLCQFTRHVRRVHRVPAYGADPLGWLDAALAIAGRQHADVLFPTQEQVAVMSVAAPRLRGAGLRTAVPDFTALAAVQDKLTAYATLTRLGLPQPPATIATSRDELVSAGPLPVFVKTPIGTASAGICQVTMTGQLRRLANQYDGDGVSRRRRAGPAAGHRASGHGAVGVRPRQADRLPRSRAHRRGSRRRRQPQARDRAARRPGAHCHPRRRARLARRPVRRCDPQPARPAVHRHQPPPGRARQRLPVRRRTWSARCSTPRAAAPPNPRPPGGPASRHTSCCWPSSARPSTTDGAGTSPASSGLPYPARTATTRAPKS